MKRVFLIVLDSFGIGEMPDAGAYGDINVNTLRSVSKSPYFHMEHMRDMGLFQIDGVGVGEKTEHPTAAYARMTERSRGNDHRTLGDCRYLFAKASAYVSQRFPRGGSGRVPASHRKRYSV